MNSMVCRVMIAAVITIAFLTGLASAQVIPIEPIQSPPVIGPPQPPTPTPTPTVRQPIGMLPEEPVGILPVTPTAEPTQTPAPTTAPPTPTQTQTTTPAQPTVAPGREQPPATAPTQQVPGVRPPQDQIPAPQNATASTVMQLSSGPGNKLNPVISLNQVAWFDENTSSVHLHNLLTGNTTVISDEASRPLMLSDELAISGDYVVWTAENPQGETSIYLYEISSGTLQQVANETGRPGLPGVSENYVVWVAGDELGDVYVYDIANGTTMPATMDRYLQLWPDTAAETFIWADNETDDGDLDIAVAVPGMDRIMLLGGAGEDVYPDISSDGNRVAWIKSLNIQTAVYLYDLTTDNTTLVTGESGEPDAVAVDGDYVVYSDWRNGNLDLYVYDIRTGVETPLVEDQYDQSLPDISAGRVVWMGNNTDQWEIYTAEVPAGSTPPGPAGGPL